VYSEYSAVNLSWSFVSQSVNPEIRGLWSFSLADAVSTPFSHDTFNLDFGVMTEVHQQAQPETGRFEIILHLGAVFVGKFGDCLEFHDDFFEANKVRFILGLQPTLFVFQRQRGLGYKRNPLQTQFDLQAFLIDCLQKPAAFLPVNLETSADNLVALVFVNQVAFHSARSLKELKNAEQAEKRIDKPRENEPEKEGDLGTAGHADYAETHEDGDR